MISREMTGVRIPAPTPFWTSTSIGTDVDASSPTYAMARSPRMESSIAQKLHTNIQIAALLICFLSVTSSMCWYITDTEASWKKK